MSIQELFSSRNNHIVDANSYVGQKDRLFFDITTQTFRISDGITPGGQVLGGIGAGTNGITVSLIDGSNNISNLVPITTKLRFDTDAGFDVIDLGGGEVKIGMNSTFKYWQVNGEDTLVANGLDTIEFKAGAGMEITTDILSNPKSITFTSVGGAGGAANLTIKDENTNLTTAVSSINFAGAGIAATHVGDAVTVTVSKGAGINKIVDVPDVYTGAGLANGQLLVYNYDSERWDTKTQLSNQNLDGGEF
jgi:hypothetical protein